MLSLTGAAAFGLAPGTTLETVPTRTVERALGDADAALLVVDGTQPVGPGDRFVARAIRAAGAPATFLNAIRALS